MAMGRIAIAFLVLCGNCCAQATINCRDTGPGRFADPADGTCKKYTLCIYVRETNLYISYKAACPSVSVFDPTTAKCTSPQQYICKNRNGVTSTPQFKICTYEGFIADPEYKNCSTYIQCVNIFGGFTQLRQNCPNNSYFNPITTLCESNYKCRKFSCVLPGRTADTTDPTCSRYYYCVLLNNGTFAQYDYSCTNDWKFDPSSKLCTPNYVCR
ncbi:hypothetical protein PYW07_016106 [Mythimna separata]|uniref:Chitin-binding type-2 domain-containing protein n=1 Tax=Mythimna separata TaxID=271217 RepID=A0AAD7YQI1_MYTSE|nr:hypothetical protein PYW07_016106 [Mythimna separata]